LLALLAFGQPAFPAWSLGDMRAVTAVPFLPDTGEARMRLRDTIFAPVGDILAARPQIITQSFDAARVSFRVDSQSGSVYLVFAAQRDGRFPLAGSGTFIIKRSLTDGGFVQAKIFLQDDPGCYIRLFPSDDRTLMDIFLFGEPVQSNVMIPAAFPRLLTMPVARIMEMASGAVDWSLLIAPRASAEDLRVSRVAAAIRARLSGLRDMDDGAMDREGRMVYIASGAPAGKGGFNCSGFAKWVVDGFFAPLTGRDTDIMALKSRDSMRGGKWSARYEEELDPYFGLDWTRGLARSVAQARSGSVPGDEELDVRDAEHVPYVKDVGYPVPRLRVVLYFLARKDPGAVYLGSVNAASRETSQEGIPTLRQHHHVIVLLPYFDAHGIFRVVVMERNAETSLASLDRRYAEEYVHLVRFDSSGIFAPPKIE
jgi:hypothetical protein